MRKLDRSPPPSPDWALMEAVKNSTSTNKMPRLASSPMADRTNRSSEARHCALSVIPTPNSGGQKKMVKMMQRADHLLQDARVQLSSYKRRLAESEAALRRTKAALEASSAEATQSEDASAVVLQEIFKEEVVSMIAEQRALQGHDAMAAELEQSKSVVLVAQQQQTAASNAAVTCAQQERDAMAAELEQSKSAVTCAQQERDVIAAELEQSKSAVLAAQQETAASNAAVTCAQQERDAMAAELEQSKSAVLAAQQETAASNAAVTCAQQVANEQLCFIKEQQAATAAEALAREVARGQTAMVSALQALSKQHEQACFLAAQQAAAEREVLRFDAMQNKAEVVAARNELEREQKVAMQNKAAMESAQHALRQLQDAAELTAAETAAASAAAAAENLKIIVAESEVAAVQSREKHAAVVDVNARQLEADVAFATVCENSAIRAKLSNKELELELTRARLALASVTAKMLQHERALQTAKAAGLSRSLLQEQQLQLHSQQKPQDALDPAVQGELVAELEALRSTVVEQQAALEAADANLCAERRRRANAEAALVESGHGDAQAAEQLRAGLEQEHWALALVEAEVVSAF
eukprot:SAG11_NODE_1032_length_6107_cov_3.885819_2_plen_587_part_00